MLYLYAIVDSAPEKLTKSLRVVRLSSGIYVVLTEIDEAPAMNAKNLVAHDRIVRRLHRASRSILALRFGSTLANEAELKTTLTPLRSLIQDALKRVRDAAQMTMRFPDLPSPTRKAPPRGGPGTRYLTKRMAESRPPEILEPAIEAVKPRDIKVARSGQLLTVYVLLDREQVAKWRRVVRGLSGFTLTGPFPPYAFAELL